MSTAPAPQVAGLAAAPVKRPRHPVWYQPEAAASVPAEGLKLLNSLTEQLEPFAPVEGRNVKWYTCGPTVYDMSHMGHARAYLTFDILRRVLEDYFGYNIQYQMNITDIDDKIIKRARVNKLLELFAAEGRDFAAACAAVAKADAHATNVLASRTAVLAAPLPAGVNSRVRDEREEKVKELALKKTQLVEQQDAIKAATAAKAVAPLLKAAAGILGEWLDAEKGHTINDVGIFDAHARKFEAEYFEDMRRLGVREPDVISRVTEVVPEVVTYVQKIIDNGFAYVGKTSVFFDTAAFVAAGHQYPKNKPTSDKAEETTADEMAEGEGSLSTAAAGEKKSPNDFALWKFSKPGEPEWESPWGKGRPGWHIECSVMASEVLGDNMDIHAGGCDLKFPHHDNELAQAEAYWGNHQWVNYFLHCGHLHIKGLKMSKSLKNFITIRQALDDLGVTPRQMRLLFLSNEWAKSMNFSDQSLGEAKEVERTLRSFFGDIEIVLRDNHLLQHQGFNAHDTALNAKWVATENAVHAALCSNVDTVTAMKHIMDLVTATQAYFRTGERPSATLLRKVGRYVTRMMQIFGVSSGTDDIGISAAAASAGGDEKVVPVVDALVAFRDQIRAAAKAKASPADLLALCDQLRDDAMPPLGVRLEDRMDGGATTWKKDDPAVLVAELLKKKSDAAAAKLSKLSNKIDKEKTVLAKWSAFTAPAAQYFSHGADKAKFSAFDAATGVPTLLADGAEVPKNKAKDFTKELAKYTKNQAELEKKGGADWLNTVVADIAAMEAEFAAATAEAAQ
jgi:cysteinyl-tRNA synthetase